MVTLRLTQDAHHVPVTVRHLTILYILPERVLTFKELQAAGQNCPKPC